MIIISSFEPNSCFEETWMLEMRLKDQYVYDVTMMHNINFETTELCSNHNFRKSMSISQIMDFDNSNRIADAQLSFFSCIYPCLSCLQLPMAALRAFFRV